MNSVLRYICILVLLLPSLQTIAFAQTLDSTNLPIIKINTYGQTIVDDPRKIVHMGIIDNGFGNMNHVTDSFNNFSGEVSIEIRGSTSQQYPKKSYAFSPVDTAGNSINFPLLGMPSENDWILYGPYPDKTLIRNKLAYYLANRMGRYASRTVFVELLLNNAYRGVYELQERIKRDNNRVDIANLTPADTLGDELTGGYIMKVDKITGTGTDSIISNYDPSVFFQYHDPEDTELLPIQKNYIAAYIDSFETALIAPWFTNPDSGYRKFAEPNSFIDFFLLQELGHTVDGYRSSCFFYKDKNSNGGKITMGPMWDFNLSFGNADYCNAYNTFGWQYQFNSVCSGYNPHVPFWWNRLLQDPAYANDLQCRWTNLRQTFLHTDSLNTWIDSIANYLSAAQQRNFVRWPIMGVYVNWNYYIGQNYADEINYLKTWMATRAAWLDNNLPGTCTVVSNGIAGTKSRLLVMPNPSEGSFTVAYEPIDKNGTIAVYNAIGEKVWENEFIQRANINLPEIAAGIYFVQVSDGTGNETAKLIIKK